jgi:hypothetical protein
MWSPPTIHEESSRFSRYAHLFGGATIQGYDLRAAQTGIAAFLLIPAALRTDLTRWQYIHDGGQNVDDARRELAIMSVEMRTAALVATGSKPEYLGWRHGASQTKNLFAYR